MQQPRPATLIAELSYQCPLHCPYCSNPLDIGHEKYRHELETEHWTRTFREARALGVLQLALTGGEPMLRRDLDELCSGARDAGLYSSLITAGVHFTRERAEALKSAGLDHVQISIQSPDAAGERPHRRQPLIREEDRGRAHREGARLPADDQLRAAQAEPRSDRGDPRSRARSRGAASRAREHAVLRLGGPEPGCADAVLGAAPAAPRRRSSASASGSARRSTSSGCCPTSTRICRSRAWAAGAGRRSWSLRTATCCPARRRRRSRGSSSPTSASIRSSGSGTSPTRSCASGARTGCRSRAARARSDARRWTSAAAAARRCGSRATRPPRTRFAGSRRITTASSSARDSAQTDEFVYRAIKRPVRA